MQHNDTEAALQQWSELLGREHVLTDEESLNTYTCSTASYSTRPLAILRPQSTEEVVGIVKTAGAFRIPLYPISRGKNWGYGDACAVSDDQVIVDLSRMNRILHVDEVLAYAVIEPGVTQKQLSDYLRERKLPLWMDCTGAGPDTSLVGNIMERGFGHSPYGNRFQTVAGMEIVLPNGEILKTGFGHYPQAKTAHLFPYGLGPYLDGIFTQSNLGIVTRLGMWLMPASERVSYFLCFIQNHEDIAPVIDGLRPLRMNGNLRSVVHIANDLRMISGSQTYPLERTGGRVPLPMDLRMELRAEAGIGAWTVTGALHGTKVQVSAARDSLGRVLKRKDRKLIYIGERNLAIGEFVANTLGFLEWGRKLKAKVAVARSLFEMNRGVPNGRFLAGAYWRRRGGLPADFPKNADPAADNCGMLWISPVLPMRGEDVLRLHGLIGPLFERYGFDLFITLSMINERSIGGVITIAYDKEDEAETQRAQECYGAVFETVMDAGYIPYRVGLQSMGDIDDYGSQVFWETVRTIKSALDPQAIIAPGRYDSSQWAKRGPSEITVKGMK